MKFKPLQAILVATIGMLSSLNANEPTEKFFNAPIHAYIPQGAASPIIHNFEITPRELATALSNEGKWKPFKNKGFIYEISIGDDFAGTSKEHRFLFTASSEAPGGILLARLMTDGVEDSPETLYQMIKMVSALIIENR